MPQIVIFLKDLGPGEKGIREMLVPVVLRRLLGSSAVVVVTGAWIGSLRTHN
jgi:hypothetical protein